ncbi:hypothetical protein PACTADRAFT_33125 [Pachysolen tannophilus NRRL Y-2460]|uniref:NADH dehydrogenase [ubiquinone] 1 alpha subcomplex subunit 1 n=1 Tax=Pachysolen tannophilus NRRL Y-2460 TaxID=669874 RepID=A0A1E4TW90_PACTA|nr:hypothetical protein PACTADRAFT_33125 [Pachysolen tannophilus NRRL Y-2460]
MIPFEGLIPYGFMFAFFVLGGATMNSMVISEISRRPNANFIGEGEDPNVKHYIKNRYNTDQWDKYFALRDLRLTGSLRGQSDNAIADEAFKTNSIQPYNNTKRPWVLRKHIIMKNSPTKWARKYSNRREVESQELKDQYIRDMNGQTDD